MDIYIYIYLNIQAITSDVVAVSIDVTSKAGFIIENMERVAGGGKEQFKSLKAGGALLHAILFLPLVIMSAHQFAA